MSPSGSHVFLLGFASGVALLAASAYRCASPGWLRWLLIGCGALLISRYVMMALDATTRPPESLWLFRHCWLARMVGLTVPSVFAVDQLLRHPALSPGKLLRWLTPLLAAYLVTALFGEFTVAPDRVAGWSWSLRGGWRVAVGAVQGGFVIGLIGTCIMLARKIPARSIRTALLGLAATQAFLGIEELLLPLGVSHVHLALSSEMACLIAFWHAYETSRTLQGG